MAYTVNQAYMKVLEEADKMGSDYFPLPVVLSRFRKIVYDFVGNRAAEIELNQQVTDDIRPLVTMKLILPIADPTIALCWNAANPVNYHTRLNGTVEYSDGSRSVRPKWSRIGEFNYDMANPYKTAAKEYPLFAQKSDYFEIYTGGAVPKKFFLTYLRNPIFGVDEADVMIDLPDQVAEHLFELTATDLFMSTGDTRAAATFQANQTYRKKEQ